MAAALAIRDDLPAAELRRLARLEQDRRIACRLLALANALDGMSRAAAARQAGMDRQTLRDWVIRFNQAGVLKPPRPPPPWPALVPRLWPAGDAQGLGAAWPRPVARWPQRLDGQGSVPAGRGAIPSGLQRERYAATTARPRPVLAGRPGRCIRRPTPRPRRLLKEAPGADRRDRRQQARSHGHRGLVPGRGPHRPDRADLPALVRERCPSARSPRSPARGGVPIWRRLLAARRRRRADPARGQCRRHATDARRTQPCRRPGCPRHRHPS